MEKKFDLNECGLSIVLPNEPITRRDKGFYEALEKINNTFVEKALENYETLIKVRVYDKRFRDLDINYQDCEQDWENLTGIKNPTYIPVSWIRGHKGGDIITLTLKDGRKMKIELQDAPTPEGTTGV